MKNVVTNGSKWIEVGQGYSYSSLENCPNVWSFRNALGPVWDYNLRLLYNFD
jgi:hypothetical protein